MKPIEKLHLWIIKRTLELTAQQGMSIQELADKSELSPSTIQNYISGKTTMKIDNIISVAVALSGSLNKFIDPMDKELRQIVSKELS